MKAKWCKAVLVGVALTAMSFQGCSKKCPCVREEPYLYHCNGPCSAWFIDANGLALC